jgi:hypothetical protein
VTRRHWAGIACLALSITLLGTEAAPLILPLWVGYVVAADAL